MRKKNGETEKEMVMFKKLTLRRTENRDALKNRAIIRPSFEHRNE